MTVASLFAARDLFIGSAQTAPGEFTFSGQAVRGLSRIIRLSVLTIAVFGLSLTATTVRAEPFAYVTNNDSLNVSVIDTVTNTVVDTVNVGSSPIGVAITPSSSGTTEPGANVEVTPTVSNDTGEDIGDTSISFTFDNVIEGGETTVTVQHLKDAA